MEDSPVHDLAAVAAGARRRRRPRVASDPCPKPDSKSDDEQLKASGLRADEDQLKRDSWSAGVEQVRGYLEDADEILEEVFERLFQGVHDGAGHAAQKVHNATERVHLAAEHAAQRVHDAADHFAKDVYARLSHWKAVNYERLPAWMKDNEHLHSGHRPQLPSFDVCFRSIFRIHTETGNIWTHLIGFLAFVVLTVVFYVRPLCVTCKLDIELSEKLIFLCFFIGAIVCLACSTLFHTLSCHSEWAQTLFSRLDYAGIATLIVGSIIPWLYYGFYCQFYARLTYMIAIGVLGFLTIVLSMWDKFNLPDFRIFRAAVFVSLGLVASVPVVHYTLANGLSAEVLQESALHWLLIVGALYSTGAFLYAARIPERFLPGKCDIWFQSHQIFHVLVIVAAFVHYHGISEMALYRLTHGSDCVVNHMGANEHLSTVY